MYKTGTMIQIYYLFLNIIELYIACVIINFNASRAF